MYHNNSALKANFFLLKIAHLFAMHFLVSYSVFAMLSFPSSACDDVHELHSVTDGLLFSSVNFDYYLCHLHHF